MLVIVKSPGKKLGDLADYRFIRPEGLVQCESMLVIDTLTDTNAWWRNRSRVPSNQGKLYGFKYSDSILIVFKQISLTH